MSNWRQNPNLVECFDSCVAMLRGLPAARVTERDEWISEIRRRRTALGLSQESVSHALGLSRQCVSGFESGSYGGADRYRRIVAALDRLEAERLEAAE